MTKPETKQPSAGWAVASKIAKLCHQQLKDYGTIPSHGDIAAIIDQHTRPEQSVNAEQIAHSMRIIIRREGGDPDKLLPFQEAVDAINESDGINHEAVRELVEAAKLQVQNFKRQNSVHENDLGDDDHEAWTALQSALDAFKAVKEEKP